MATSETINGTISGYRPYLRLNWSRIETDVGGNRSKLRLQLYLMHPYTVRYSATKSGVLQGSSFNSSTNVNGTGSTLLRTQEIWVGHNADGSKTQSLSASFNINITYSGSWLGQLTVSGNANITAIPRASTLSAFSFASHLQPNTEVNLNYTIDRKSDNFRHHIQLRDGSYVVQTWDNVSSDGSSSVKLSTTSVNDLLNRMSNVTSKTLTLRVATRSGVGGGWIGSAVTRTATATVSDNVKPSVGALSLSQTGNIVSSDYLQGKSRITASLTVSAGYGETISSTSITIRRKGSNDDVQTISGSKGTTSRAVRYSGTYQAQGEVRDSRGRTSYTAWTDFPVTAYSGPRITNFTAVRSSSTPTIVSISRAGTHTHLGGSNILTYTVQRRIGAGAWTNVNTNASGTSTSSSFSGTSTSTGNSTTASYEFRMVITDMFGETAESIVTTSTQRVVLDVHKNEGVGIGKIHERGVLDVDGSAYFKGNLFVNDVNISNAQSFSSYIAVSGLTPDDSIDFWQRLPQGKYFVTPNNFPNQPEPYGVIDHSTLFGDFNTIWYTQSTGAIYRKSGNGDSNFSWILIDRPDRGTNENGNWIHFNDGTQICWNNKIIDPSGMGYKRGTTLVTTQNIRVYYPHAFVGLPALTVTGNVGGLHASFATANNSSNIDNFFLRFIGEDYSTEPARYNYIAIGRWK